MGLARTDLWYDPPCSRALPTSPCPPSGDRSAASHDRLETWDLPGKAPPGSLPPYARPAGGECASAGRGGSPACFLGQLYASRAPRIAVAAGAAAYCRAAPATCELAKSPGAGRTSSVTCYNRSTILQPCLDRDWLSQTHY